MLHLYFKCAFFAAKPMCAILCAHVCDGRPSLLANLGLPDDFPQYIFPTTPPGNGNVGWGTRALSESGFKVGENSLPGRSAAGEI